MSDKKGSTKLIGRGTPPKPDPDDDDIPPLHKPAAPRPLPSEPPPIEPSLPHPLSSELPELEPSLPDLPSTEPPPITTSDGSAVPPTGPLRRLSGWLWRGITGLIDGYKDADGPWRTSREHADGLRDSLSGPYDSVNHGVFTGLDLASRIVKKSAAWLILRFLDMPLLRAIGLKLFKFGIWLEAKAITKFSGFYDVIGVFTHNRIGSVEFFRKLAWSIFGTAGTFALAAGLEVLVSPILLWLASFGFPLVALVFIFTPLLACASFFVSDYAVKLVGSCIAAALDPVFKRALSSPVMVVSTLAMSTVIGLTIGELIGGLAAIAGVTAIISAAAVPVVALCLGAMVAPILGSMISAYCRHHPGGFIARIVNAVDNAINSLFSWLTQLFEGSSAGATPASNSRGRGPRVKVRAKRSRMRRRSRRVLPPPNSEMRRWWPPQFFPLPTTGEDPPPEQPSVPEAGSPPPKDRGATRLPKQRQTRPARISGMPVGGVLFDHCAEVLTGIEEITGAYRDEATGSLVLIGKATGDQTPLHVSVPSMDLDHIYVAMRAAIIGEPMGVSIDPPAGFRYGGVDKILPDKTPLLVSYLGSCAGTLAGAIFFEADRIMKCLSVGRDNHTRKVFASHVPGYHSTFDLRDCGWNTGRSWHRFWFVVDRVEIKKSSQSSGFVFGNVKIAVKTELQMQGGTAGQTIDPLDVQFANHLTEHYDEYAKEFPVFARLKELGKVSAIASFFVNYLSPTELGNFLETPPTQVDTPDETPSILRTESTQRGNVLCTHMVSGGVNMSVNLEHKMDSTDELSRLARIAMASRPLATPHWEFGDGAARLRATSVPIVAPTLFRPVETDHRFLNGSSASSDFALQRVYIGSHVKHGMFGPGWDIFVPFSLTVAGACGKRSEVLDPERAVSIDRTPSVIFLRETETGAAYVYRKITDPATSTDPCWALVRSQTVCKESASFTYDASNCIHRRNNYFFICRKGREYRFDDAGCLIEVFRAKSLQARYKWQDGVLAEMEDGSGQRYTLSYSRADNRVERIVASDGHTIQYLYGSDECLQEVRTGSQSNAQYGYDTGGRLTEMVGVGGSAIARAAYKTTGAIVIEAGRDELPLEEGGVIKRYLDQGRVELLRDDHGVRAKFSYFTTGHLTSITVTDTSKASWRFEYAANRTLKRVIDPLGRTTEAGSVRRQGMDHFSRALTPAEGRKNQVHYTAPALVDVMPYCRSFPTEVSRKRASLVKMPPVNTYSVVFQVV